MFHVTHKWKTILDTGYVEYQECKGCGRRKIVFTKGISQPIDQQWLCTGMFTPNFKHVVKSPSRNNNI